MSDAVMRAGRTGRGAAAAALAAALAVGCGTVQAEEPGDRAGGAGPRRDARAAGPDRPADAEVDAWVAVLTERMVHRNDLIRDSARAALVALGPVAAPRLAEAAHGPDGAAAEAARRVLHAIHEDPGRRGPPPHVGPGGPGAPPAGGPRGEGRGPGEFRGRGPGAGPGPDGGPGGPHRGPGPRGPRPGDGLRGPPPGGPGGPPREGEGRRPDPLREAIESLGLDAAAREAVAKALEDHHAARRKQFEERRAAGAAPPDAAALRAEREKAHEDLMAALKGALGDERFERFLKAMEERRPR